MRFAPIGRSLLFVSKFRSLPATRLKATPVAPLIDAVAITLTDSFAVAIVNRAGTSSAWPTPSTTSTLVVTNPVDDAESGYDQTATERKRKRPLPSATASIDRFVWQVSQITATSLTCGRTRITSSD